MESISSLLRANDPYEMLISHMIRIERQPQLELEQRKEQQERIKSVLSDFDSKLSALHSLLETFTDDFSNPFAARTATTGSEAFGVSVTDDAAYGTHTLKVERLASTDTRVGKQLTKSGTTLSDFFSTNGAQTFYVSVAHPTDSDPNNRVNVEVTVNPTGSTDEEILKEIAQAINDAMYNAVSGGTIENTERAHASVVSETSDTIRLSLRSGQTGFTHRLEFTDSANGLLALLEVNNNAVATGTGGGQVKAVGTSETDSELNSKFVLDGLTLYRDGNEVSDALQGVTLSLKEADGTAAEFTISPDAESVKEKILEFIEKYNEVLDFIKSKTEVDGSAGIRADLAGDTTIRGLRFDMRNDVASEVTGLSGDALTYLSEIGITIEDDGTLELSDADLLLAEVERDSNAVRQLFDSSDGIATRLINRLDRFLGVDGIIDNREEVYDERIRRLKDQIDRWDERLEIRENQLREQFARLQETVALLQGQQQTLGMFFGG